MLSISQLATYAGVTVRAVRHYHHIGLLAEAERDHSGYRTYDAAAVVRLIRIRTLADAGVPLSRVQRLLQADPETFAREIQEIDGELRREIRRLQANRKRVAQLAAGDQLALPPSVVEYLACLRRLGVAERYLELERDSWIMIAAQTPDQIERLIEGKRRELEDPDTVRLYALLSEAIDWSYDDPRIVEIADIVERLMQRFLAAGGTYDDGLDDRFVELLDASTRDAGAVAERLLDLLEERGWQGWTRMVRASENPN